jgi:hypothetical protein
MTGSRMVLRLPDIQTAPALPCSFPQRLSQRFWASDSTGHLIATLRCRFRQPPQRFYRRLFAALRRAIGPSANALAGKQPIDASDVNVICLVDRL